MNRSAARQSGGFVAARDNPLSVHKVTAVPFRFPVGNWETHLQRLQLLRYRGAIVGPQGSGKTTLLRELSKRLQSTGRAVCYLFLPQEAAHREQLVGIGWQAARSGQIVLIDGWERLRRQQRRQLIQATGEGEGEGGGVADGWGGAAGRPGGGLIVNSHRPCRLPTWVHLQPTRDTLIYVLNCLERLDQPPFIARAEQLFAVHAGNVRDVLRALYDDVADGRLPLAEGVRANLTGVSPSQLKQE